MQPVYTAVQLMGTRYQKIYVINGLAYHAYIAAHDNFGLCRFGQPVDAVFSESYSIFRGASILVDDDEMKMMNWSLSGGIPYVLVPIVVFLIY